MPKVLLQRTSPKRRFYLFKQEGLLRVSDSLQSFLTKEGHASRRFDMLTTDRATRMADLTAYSKTFTVSQAARKYSKSLAQLHGIPTCIYMDRGRYFACKFWRGGRYFAWKFWRGLWELFSIKLRYSTAYHTQTRGIVERMNAALYQVLRCT